MLKPVSVVWPWLAVAGLGAYHGLDPSMGWLFAVALGLQERSLSRVILALGPLALGHLMSIGVVVAFVVGLGAVIAITYVRPVGAAILVAFGVFRFVWPRAHPRWVAMRVNSGELALWSFLMSSAHGAGLMLFPILLRMSPGMCVSPIVQSAHPIVQAGMVVLLHTGAMLAVMGAVSILVYQYAGLAILRSAWINLDMIWAGALVAAGLFSLAV
jgi:hypothetical protein